jgi:hypothetical protein
MLILPKLTVASLSQRFAVEQALVTEAPEHASDWNRNGGADQGLEVSRGSVIEKLLLE